MFSVLRKKSLYHTTFRKEKANSLTVQGAGVQDLMVSPAGFGNKVVGRDSLGKRTADFRQRGFARGWDGGCRISALQLLRHY